jgi:intracellular sulfur oxidation DsrE/DsrF family protein
MSRGVKIELCGGTAKAHHYGNQDLLPGILVNTDAMARTTELVQQCFAKIPESLRLSRPSRSTALFAQ